MSFEECEICGEWDPDVIERHHIIPKNHAHEGMTHKGSIIIYMCACCHVKSHALYGGTKARTYRGPKEKDKFIREIKRVRGRYMYKSGEGAAVKKGKIPTLTPNMVAKLVKEYKNTNITIIALAKKYNYGRELVRKAIVSAAKPPSLCYECSVSIHRDASPRPGGEGRKYDPLHRTPHRRDEGGAGV